MILSKEDTIKLNYLSHGDGAVALEYLATKLWEYYTKELANCPSELNELNKGKAQLADWLKMLPKGLNDVKSTAR